MECEHGNDCAPCRKRATIIILLDHWPEFFEPASSGRTTLGQDGAGVALLSSMSTHRSVVELTRCLELCRRMAPAHYKHFIGYYGAEWRTTTRQVKRQLPSRKWVVEPARVRERVVAAWVTSRMVERALDFVCGAFNGVPELPVALTRKLRPLADTDGWTEAA